MDNNFNISDSLPATSNRKPSLFLRYEEIVHDQEKVYSSVVDVLSDTWNQSKKIHLSDRDQNRHLHRGSAVRNNNSNWNKILVNHVEHLNYTSSHNIWVPKVTVRIKARDWSNQLWYSNYHQSIEQSTEKSSKTTITDDHRDEEIAMDNYQSLAQPYALNSKHRKFTTQSNLSPLCNFATFPKVLSKNAPDSIFGHTSTIIDNTIYTFGGYHINQLAEETLEKRKENFSLLHHDYQFNYDDDHDDDHEKYAFEGRYIQNHSSFSGPSSYPFPLSETLLNSEFIESSQSVINFNTITNTLKTIPVKGDPPPGLIYPKSVQISDRHILYYGGFILKKSTSQAIPLKPSKDIPYRSKSSCVGSSLNDITDCLEFKFANELVMNTSGWIFDIKTLRFKIVNFQLSRSGVNTKESKYNDKEHKIKDYNVDDENLIPGRFGFSMVSIPYNHKKYMEILRNNPNIKKNNIQQQSKKDDPISPEQKAIVYIFGGYIAKEKEAGSNEYDYKTLDDLWKIEFYFKRDFNDSRYFKFNDNAIVTNIKEKKLQQQEENGNAINFDWPKPRGFHAATIHGNKVFSKPSFVDEELEDKSLTNYDYPSNMMVIHGGVKGSYMYSGVWWFNIETEVWTKIKTYSMILNKDKLPTNNKCLSIVRRGAHEAIAIGKYMVLLGGILRPSAECKDLNHADDIRLSDSVLDITHQNPEIPFQKGDKNLQFHLLALNLQTQTWTWIKYYHKLDSFNSGEFETFSFSRFSLTYHSVAFNDGRMYFIGGILNDNKPRDKSDATSPVLGYDDETLMAFYEPDNIVVDKDVDLNTLAPAQSKRHEHNQDISQTNLLLGGILAIDFPLFSVISN